MYRVDVNWIDLHIDQKCLIGWHDQYERLTMRRDPSNCVQHRFMHYADLWRADLGAHQAIMLGHATLTGFCDELAGVLQLRQGARQDDVPEQFSLYIGFKVRLHVEKRKNPFNYRI